MDLLFPLPQHWMGVGVQGHTPATLPPEKTRYPLYRSLGGHQGWSGGVRKILPPLGFDPRTVRPVANCNTNCAIPAHRTLNIVLGMVFSICGKIQTEHGLGYDVIEGSFSGD
jgi:hypothetical protein